MALTNTALKDYISTYVKNNGRREITGDQVGYALTEIVNYIDSEIAGVGGENYSNANLSFTQSRTHNANGYAVDFQGLSQHKWAASAVPPAGEASFVFQGYGSASSNQLFNIKNGTGTDVVKVTGDGVVNLGSMKIVSSGTTVAIGYGPIDATGNSSVKIGYYSGSSSNSNFTVIVGGLAGQVSAANCVYVGYRAGMSATGSNNVAVGYQAFGAGSNFTVQSVSVGYQSAGSATNAHYSVSVGYQAGNNVTTGTNNVVIGHTSGSSITTGTDNTIIGKGADLGANVSGHVYISDGQNNPAIVKDNNHNVWTGATGALATTATNGFFFIPTCAGTPTGSPTSISGKSPIIHDTTNDVIYVHNGTAWVGAALT